MINRLFHSLQGDRKRERLPYETLFEDKYQDLRIILAQPEVMPCYFDNTIKFWLMRIGLWGKLKIKYTNTNPNKSEWITPGKVEQLLGDATTLNTFGSWDVEKLGFKTVVIKRDYVDPSGKKHKERIWIDIELKPEIKKGMQFSESLEYALQDEVKSLNMSDRINQKEEV